MVPRSQRGWHGQGPQSSCRVAGQAGSVGWGREATAEGGHPQGLSFSSFQRNMRNSPCERKVLQSFRLFQEITFYYLQKPKALLRSLSFQWKPLGNQFQKQLDKSVRLACNWAVSGVCSYLCYLIVYEQKLCSAVVKNDQSLELT